MGAVRVSVVVPCFNSARWLPETVACLEAQTLADFEVVLVDDGSTDGTGALVERLAAAKPSLVTRTPRQANGGLASARNLGIRHAAGRYILPLDADDLLTEDFLERCAAELDEHPDVDVVYTERLEFGTVERLVRPGPFALEQLRYFNRISYASMYRRRLWDDVGGYRTNVSGFDDWDLWVAAAARGCRGRFVPGPRLLHRRRPGSLMSEVIHHYERLFATIVLNNPGAYAPDDVEAARRLVHEGRRSALFSAASFVFRRAFEGAAPDAVSGAGGPRA